MQLRWGWISVCGIYANKQMPLAIANFTGGRGIGIAKCGPRSSGDTASQVSVGAYDSSHALQAQTAVPSAEGVGVAPSRPSPDGGRSRDLVVCSAICPPRSPPARVMVGA
jgi:hypothetical protein